MTYTVKKILKSDWQKYRDIRLEALKNEPSAFGSSYITELNRTDKDWQERFSMVEKSDGDRFFHSVCDNNRMISIGGAFRDNNDEWNVVAIYTKSEYRGLGIGKLLMTNILDEFNNRAIKKIFLKVNINQKAAISLYKKFDFKIINTVKNKLMGDGNYYDEYEMIKEL